jgi:hypothetical protein
MAGRQSSPAGGLLQELARLRVPREIVVPALLALVEADSRLDVAHACLPLLVQLPGVRAAAVVQRADRDAVVLASAGYDCGAMGPGARLPLTSGLPTTEAVRTGRLVEQGTGPSWVALPFGRGPSAPGALLLSLDVAPPGDAEERSRLQQVAAALGAALHRAGTAEGAGTADEAGAAALAGLVQVSTALGSHGECCPGTRVVVRQLPRTGDVGGDVALCLPAGDGGCWLVMADVCGSGPAAAPLAVALQAAALASSPYAAGPSQLLSDLDRAVRPAAGDGRFVTAVAVHLRSGRARVASAGHPPPLLLDADGVVELGAPPGPPLALDGQPAERCPERSWPVPAGSVVLLHTDGLTDRRAAGGVSVLDAARLCAGRGPSDLESLADGVLSSAAAAGLPGDDVSLLLAQHG